MRLYHSLQMQPGTIIHSLLGLCTAAPALDSQVAQILSQPHVGALAGREAESAGSSRAQMLGLGPGEASRT